MKPLLVAGLAVAMTGCPYASGTLSYAEQPELRQVRLYSGKPDPRGENIAPVAVIRSGASDCTQLGNAALADLLREAQAIGGTAVKDVRFRGRYNWMGRVVCRRSMSGMSVEVRGIATR